VAVDRFDTRARDLAARRRARDVDESDVRRVYESTPAWAPDGQAFVYALARDAPELFFKRMGTPVRTSGCSAIRFKAFRKAVAGQSIHRLYDRHPNTSKRHLAVPDDRRSKPVPFLHARLQKIMPNLAGRTMDAYVSNESGRSSVYGHALSRSRAANGRCR
jgi:hypothetical protein